MAYAKILSDLKQKKYKPVYFFDGDEPYYIDALSDYIAENVLDDGQKEFNQSIVYARDINPDELPSIVKRYPMMADYQVVIVREAQFWPKNKLEDLSELFTNPVSTTILVLNYKGKKLDGRSSLVKGIKKNGVYFNSKKLRDYEVPAWIKDHCRSHNISIDPQAAAMLSEHIGANLSNLIQAFEKLDILLPKGQTITPKAISTHIGISKDFNIFELQKSIGMRDAYKALFIANYFANNQKDHHVVMITSGLFRYFDKLITYHGMRGRTDKQSIAKAMGVHPYFMGEYQQAAAYFTPARILPCIDIIYDIELKAKGVNSSGVGTGKLVKEMVGRLLRV